MPTYRQVNKSTNVVNVGRTAPVDKGQAPAEKSLPVVLASDAPPVPVVEQNKVQSEVALSLLGIPRSEVALGIFADVNTYDVNPSEWSINPVDKRQFTGGTEASGIRKFIYEGQKTETDGSTSDYSNNEYNWGLTHVPEEAGAMIEAPPGETSTLTSKRFFRYQPGRVSSATFGVKTSARPSQEPDRTNRNPSIRKYGIYDKYDGYYWENRDTGRGDQFGVTRRTQSIIDFRFPHQEFSINSFVVNSQYNDYGIVGKGKESGEQTSSLMNSPIASCNGNVITLHKVYANGDSISKLRKHFKDGLIPQVGMSVRNVTFSTVDSPMGFGGVTNTGTNAFEGLVADTDESPLFRESTVVTAVNKGGTNNQDLLITLNNAPIKGSVYNVGDATKPTMTSSVNPENPANGEADSTANGRITENFGSTGNATSALQNYKRLKFTFAGDNMLVRDNLPLTSAAIFDPSLLKDRVEYAISSANATDGTVTFSRPSSAQGINVGTDSGKRALTQQAAVQYDDSPNGLYVHNVFSFGQIVEYTTDAESFTGDAGHSLLKGGSQANQKKNVFIIDKIDIYNNSIRLRDLSSAGGGLQTETEGALVSFESSAASSFNDTKHFIKTPVPFMFPEVQYAGGDGYNVSDIMFPYTRGFSTFGMAEGTDSQQQLTGNSHRTDNQAGLVSTDLTGTGSDFSNRALETMKSEINDINSGLSCHVMSFGRTYEANRTSTTSALTADNGTTNNDKRYHAKSSGWRYFTDDQVNPEYWGVYEYKVPRSRFSFDSLNGNPGEQIYYSDLVKVDGIPKYPGQPFESSTEATTRTSLWEIDFENVIMQKIEFSWYGAVGALFLAYVPTGTGEARWVRIHHLRCSNQLKTASLGNATLPLTYTIYGGGVPKQYGSSSLLTSGYSSGKSVSEFVTKYGSSYYIDGGDRGTVRLFNYSQPAASRVSTSLISDEHIVADDIGTASTTFRLDAPSMNREDLYFGAQVSFGDSTLAANVIHVERQGKKDRVVSGSVWTRDVSPGVVTITLDRVMTPNSPVKFILKSPYSIFGITSKTNIESSQNFLVRNRVQVYPTKLSVGMQTLDGQKANTSLSLQKNVIFQDDAVYDYYASDAMKRYNTLVFRGATDASLELAGSGLPTRLSSSNASPISIDTSSESAQNADQVAGDTNFGPYRVGANVGDKIYGWARVTNSVNEFTLFGRIEVVDLGSAKNSPVWDFIPEDTYTGTVRFKNGSSFTHAYQYYNDLGVHHNTTTKQGRLSTKLTTDEQNSITQQIERLSSVNVNNEIRRPIPGTGTTIASFFLKDGSDYFDLAPYFDYNKDYISFPLTNIPDNLFIGARINEDLLDPGADTTHGHSDITATSRSPRVAVSLTWEEQ